MPACSSFSISSISAAGIDHHAVADDGLDPGPQNAARNQLENELLRANKYGVPGVVAALIASHH